MPSIDKLRHNIRHAVSLSAFSPNLIHRIRYFFSLYSYFPRLLTLAIPLAARKERGDVGHDEPQAV